MYACVFPAAIVVLIGVTAIETKTAGVTASVAPGDVMDPWVAVIVVDPTPTPVAIPEAVIEATGVFDEFHVTPPVMFCVVWLLNVPVAV